jgi:hypothetical protein
MGGLYGFRDNSGLRIGLGQRSRAKRPAAGGSRLPPRMKSKLAGRLIPSHTRRRSKSAPVSVKFDNWRARVRSDTLYLSVGGSAGAYYDYDRLRLLRLMLAMGAGRLGRLGARLGLRRSICLRVLTH